MGPRVPETLTARSSRPMRRDGSCCSAVRPNGGGYGQRSRSARGPRRRCAPEALLWRQRHEARKGYDGAVDMVPCREHVLAERARAAGSFADTIVNNGVIVYERH